NNHDLALAREVLLLEPFRLKARTVERGKVWQTIADNLNSHATLSIAQECRRNGEIVEWK
ncbi:unnamed protein product, partial [Porites evermanni]